MDDMTDSIAPKSDQLNAEDLLAGPRTFTITRVRVLDSPDQPVHVYLDGHPDRPFKPSKTVRRLLVVGWGTDSAAYVGKRITLYRDPEVKWGGQDVGGIRVSHMSGLTGPLNVALTVTRGRRAPYTVDPLPDGPAPVVDQRAASLPVRAGLMVDTFATLGVTEDDLERKIGRPRAGWAQDDLERMAEVFRMLQRGEVTRDVAFPRPKVTADDLPPDPGQADLDPATHGPSEPAPDLDPESDQPSVPDLLDRLGVREGEDRYALVSLYVGRQTTQHQLTDAEYETVLAALATIAGQDDEGRAADLARDLAEARQLAAERDPQ